MMTETSRQAEAQRRQVLKDLKELDGQAAEGRSTRRPPICFEPSTDVSWRRRRRCWRQQGPERGETEPGPVDAASTGWSGWSRW